VDSASDPSAVIDVVGLGKSFGRTKVLNELNLRWGVPRWVMDFSPFSHSPILPGPDAEMTGMVWLTIVASVLLAGGSAAFRRRDLAS
jgi:ABC-2 type transport system permease protein